MRGHLLGVVGLALVQAPIAAADAAKSETTTEVFFPFDVATLNTTDRSKLDELAGRAMLAGSVVIDGHADAIGTSPYNVGLALRRAEAAKDYLIERGIDEDNVVITTYGEDGPRRSTHAQDRRVSITLIEEPLYVIVDRAFPVATAMIWGKPATTAEIEGLMREEPPEQVATP